jgi:hypothetical protein
MKIFYELYIKDNVYQYITERHKNYVSPVLIDLDFKFKKIMIPRAVSNKVINGIIEYLTSVLTSIFGKSHDYMCVVSQRPEQYKKGKEDKEYYSDGLHIIFPYIICSYDILFSLRRKFMKEYVIEIGQFNNMEKIYDIDVIKKNAWMLYKSTKKNMKPYEIVKIYNSNVEIEDNSVLEWTKILSIRYGVTIDVQLNPINSEPIKDYKHDEKDTSICFNLFIFVTINGYAIILYLFLIHLLNSFICVIVRGYIIVLSLYIIFFKLYFF